MWDGSTLTPQGNAKASVLQVSGSMMYDELNSVTLSQFLALVMPSNAPISSPAANAIIAVHTNGGNSAKLLVTSNSGGSLGLQYTTFGATAPSITHVQNAASNTPSGLPNGAIAQGALFVVKGSNLGPATFIQQTGFRSRLLSAEPRFRLRWEAPRSMSSCSTRWPARSPESSLRKPPLVPEP